MTDKDAPKSLAGIIDGTIEPCSPKASGDGRDDPANPGYPVGCAITRVAPVQFPLTESNPMTPEMAENRHPDRKSNPSQWQTPLTRSTHFMTNLSGRLVSTRPPQEQAFSRAICLSSPRSSGQRKAQCQTRSRPTPNLGW